MEDCLERLKSILLPLYKMLTEKQTKEIIEHLEKSQNPVFLYDNDADGLCSFVLLRRFLGRGKGVAIRSYPDLDVGYAKRAQELGADCIFVLDKPVLSQEFLEEADKMQIPLVWIDHHEVPENDMEKFENVYLYNPQKNKGKNKSSEPVTALVYNITKRKEDVWLAIIGCIADHYLPDFHREFEERYGEMWGKVKKPFDAYYGTEIGKIARALNFGLKDSVTRVVELQNFLIQCEHPNEVLSEVSGNKSFRYTYNAIRERYDRILASAEENKNDKLIFFSYGGETSMSADLANELSYKNPGKYIAIAFIKGPIANISLRGNKVREILLKILKEFPEASGGGHEDAVGARIKSEELEKFKMLFEKEIK